MDVFWLEATPWDPAMNGPITVRACSIDLSAIVLAFGQEWLPVMDGGLVISTTAFDGTFAGRARSTRGELALLTAAAEIDTWASYVWASRSVKVWTAEITGTAEAPIFPAARTLLFDGESESFDPDRATLFLNTRQPVGQVASDAYAGTGGLEGTAALKGVRKPFAAGRLTNASVLLIDAGKLLFQVHGYGTIEQLIGVHERGILLDQPFVEHATFLSLQSAIVPATEIHRHTASATFRLGFMPAGDITVDFIGVNRGTTATLIGDVVKELLVRVGFDLAKVDLDSLTELNAANPNPVLFYDAQGADIADALTTLLAGAGAYWDVDQLGYLYTGMLTMASSADLSIGDEGTADYDLIEIDNLPVPPPFWKIRLGYGQNPNVMTFVDTEAGALADEKTLPGQLLRDDLFDPTFWTVPANTIIIDDTYSPSGKSLEIGYGSGPAQFTIYGGSTAQRVPVGSVDKLFVRLSVIPSAATWDLVVRVPFVDASFNPISTAVALTFDRTAGAQTLVGAVAVPAGAVWAGLEIGHATGGTNTGTWRAFAPWLSEVEPAADVTVLNAPSMIMPPSQTVAALSNGTPKAGQFDRTLLVYRKKGNIDVTAQTNFVITVNGVAATINNAPGSASRGQIVVTDMMAPLNGTISVTSTYEGVDLVQTIKFTKDQEAAIPPPPAPGTSSGSSATVSVSTTFANTAFSGSTPLATARLTLTAGQVLRGTAPLTYGDVLSESSSRAACVWEYSPAGAGTWTAMGAEIVGTNAHNTYAGGDYADPYYVEGYGNFNQSVSGLAAADYDLRLMARRYSGTAANTAISGTVTMTAGT